MRSILLAVTAAAVTAKECAYSVNSRIPVSKWCDSHKSGDKLSVEFDSLD